MSRTRPRLSPLTALLLLTAFLAWGIYQRVTQGPLENGAAMMGFAPVDTVLGEAPPCIASGEVGRNSTLSQVLDREGVPREQAGQFLLQLASLTDMKNIRPRDSYRLFSTPSGNVTRLEFQPDPVRYFVVERDSSGLKAWREDEPVERVQRRVNGTVRGSLYASMQARGIDPTVIANFCDVFSCEIDFATETKSGDTFEFLIEETVKEGQPVGAGRLLGGRYTNDGQTTEAVYFERSPGHGAFYQPNGQSLRRAFLKSPLNYSRISSGFTQRRVHPIFKTVRPHLGVDYAAAQGTPVVSIADGTVVSSGWVNGYGNLVRIRHTSGIVTYYAHLSRFGKGIRKGAAVDQNQVIGYVGQTGHATGPHLDFRIEQNGRFVNPLKFKSKGGEPLEKSDRPDFEKVLAGYREAMTEEALASARVM